MTNTRVTDAPKPLLIVGSPDAAACEGDFCEIPEHHTQAQVNRQLDADLV